MKPSIFAAPRRFLLRPLAQALAASALLSLPLQAQNLPSGLQVVHGQAQVSTQGQQMTVTNSHNAILNWNRFGIGAGHGVHFQQPDAASKVLNRVVGQDPSLILGRLSSNGQVWLLNPNGILFGAQARVDVASLVASTLNLADQDWLGGRWHFERDAGAPSASLVNQGELRSAQGGRVLLLAGELRNEGRIEAPAGQLVLAAGRQIELVDTATPHVRVTLQLADGEALNQGLLEAAGGRIDVHAAAVRQDGQVRANGEQGGAVELRSHSGRLLLSGSVQALGRQGQGGQIHLFGPEVGVLGTASLDASGPSGGGELLIGGGWQGQDRRYPNSRAVYFGPDASARADALHQGDGGRIVLWADEATRAYGHFSAQGGGLGGQGGWLETSGGWVDAQPSSLNLRAPQGRAGTWLLDPLDLWVVNSTFSSAIDTNVSGSTLFVTPTGSPAQVMVTTIASALLGGQNVTLSTSAGAGAESGDIHWSNANLSVPVLPSAVTLTLIAERNIEFSGGSISAGSLSVDLQSNRSAGSGSIRMDRLTLNVGGSLNAGGFGGGSALGSNSLEAIHIGSSSLYAGSGISLRGNNGQGQSGVVIQGSSLSTNDLSITGVAKTGKGIHVSGSSLQANRSARLLGQGSDVGVQVDGGGKVSVSSDGYFAAGKLEIAGTGDGSSALGVQLSSAGATVVEAMSIGELTIKGSTNAAGGTAVDLFAGSSAAVLGLDGVPRLRVEAQQGQIAGRGPVVQMNTPAPEGQSTLFQAPSMVWTDATIAAAGIIKMQANSHVFSGAGTRIGGAGAGQSLVVMGQDGSQGANRIDNQTGASLIGPALTKWTLIGMNPTDGSIVSAGNQFNPNGLNPSYKAYGRGYDPGFIASLGNGFHFSNPVAATVSGAPISKVYDATTAVNTAGVSFGGVAGDTLSLKPGVTLSFANKNVGTGKALSLSSADPFNAVDDQGRPVYGYAAPSAGLSGNITPATLLISGLTALNRVYDGTTGATLGGTASVTPLLGDSVIVNAAGAQFNDKHVGVAKPVSIGSLSLGGADGANYTPVLSAALTADITPRPLALSGLVASSKVYDGSTAATLSGSVLLSVLGADSVSLAGTPSAVFDSRHVGSDKTVSVSGLALAGADAGNYSLPATLSLTASITPLAVGVTGLSALDKTYDGTTAASVVGTPSIAVLGGDAVTVTGSPSAVFSSRHAGTARPVTLSGLSLSGPQAGNYTLNLNTGLTADIQPAPLLIAGLQGQSKEYDGTVNATVRGTAVFNTLAGDVVTLGSVLGQFADKHVGQAKPITVNTLTLAGADAGNYTPVLANGLQADITPLRLPVTGLSAADKVYDGSTQAVVLGTPTIAPLAGDSVALFGTVSGQLASKNAGPAQPVQLSGLSLVGLDAANYTLDLGGSLQAAIAPAALSVTGLVAQNKVYDGSTVATVGGTPVFTALPGDSVAVQGVATAQFADRHVGTHKEVTVTGFTLSGPDAGNYLASTSVVLHADITPLSIGLSGLSALDKVYDGSTTATLIGTPSIAALAGDGVMVTGTASGQFASRHAGSGKQVAVSGLSLSGPDAGNYLLDQSLGLLASIQPAPLLVTGLAAQSKVYDGTTAATLVGTPSVAALAGDQVGVGTLEGVFDSKHVGAGKPVTLSAIVLNGADAGNYVAKLAQPLSADISPRPLLLSGLVVTSKVYDGSDLAILGGSPLLNALPGDAVNLGASPSARYDSKQVGTHKPVQLSGLSLAGADAGNYVLQLAAPLTGSIVPRQLPVSGFQVQTKVYDGSTQASLSGSAQFSALPGDSVLVSGTPQASFSGPNAAGVGTDKPVSWSGLVLGGSDGGNYQLSFSSLTGTVTPAPLVYEAAQTQRRVGQTVGDLGGQVTGFVPGDNLANATQGQLSWSVPGLTPASLLLTPGPFAVQGAGLSAANYFFVQAAGNASALQVHPLRVVDLEQATALAAGDLYELRSPVPAPLGGFMLPALPSQTPLGLLDLSSPPLATSPGAGVPAASALADPGSSGEQSGGQSGGAVAPAGAGLRVVPGAGVAAGGTPGLRFAALDLSSMSMHAIQQVLDERARIKRRLFEQALLRLENNPALADLASCTTRAEAEAGNCLVTESLRLELQAEPGPAAAKPAPAPAATAAQPAARPLPNLALRRAVKSAALPQIERKIALIIGVNEYRDGSIPQLEGAVGDAEALAALAESQLGYETVLLRNPSKAELVAVLNKLALELRAQDSVLVYYAGHGDEVNTPEGGKQGYWQLADSEAKRPETWLSNNDIGRLLRAMSARQVALLSDSCYSGSLVTGQRLRALPAPATLNPAEVLGERTVVVMSSGGNAPVADSGENGHSPFAYHLFQALAKVPNWKPGANVFETVRFQVARKFPQSPQYGFSGPVQLQRPLDYLFEQRKLDPR